MSVDGRRFEDGPPLTARWLDFDGERYVAVADMLGLVGFTADWAAAEGLHERAACLEGMADLLREQAGGWAP